MAYRLPPLNALRQFEAAARHLSFRSAADELNVTPSAVSHGVQTLETALGVALFVRDRRGLALTSEGAAYLPRVREGLDMLARAAEVLSPRAVPKRRLSLSVAPSFATRWLLQNLHRFHAQHHDIEIFLDTERRLVEFPRDEVDIAIRRGQGGWPGLVCERLLFEELVPVCAPAVAESIRGAEDLTGHTLLHVTAVAEDWCAWAQSAGLDGTSSVDLERGLRFDTLEMAWGAAAQGVGIAIGRLPLISADLEAGRLVSVLGPPVRARTGYWLVTARATLERAETIAFLDWLRQELSAPVERSSASR